MKNTHYFIRRTSLRTGRVEYKKNKCVDGWSNIKAQCWQFSRSSAKQIVSDLQKFSGNNYYQYLYDLVEGTLPYSGRDIHCD